MRRFLRFTLGLCFSACWTIGVLAERTERPAEFAVANRHLEGFAKALATQMNDPATRQLVAGEAAKRFDGDTEFLYRAVANQATSHQTSLHQRLRTVAANSGFSSASSFDRFTNRTPRLQIAVPGYHRQLRNSLQPLLVTYWPVGRPDHEVLELKAFDAQGRVHLLDAQGSVDRLVVVVGLNERTDAMGYLRPGFVATKMMCGPEAITCDDGGGGGGGGGGGSSCDAGATHASGDPETLATLLISDDHEPSWKGDPEIYVRWANPNSGLISTREFAGVDNENQTYTLDSTLFSWTWPVPSSLGFVLEVWEDDANLLGTDGDDFVGSAYVDHSDANCRSYQGGDATFSMKFK